MTDLPVETTTEDVQAAPRKSGRQQLDMILALSAIFISGVSLAVAIQNSAMQRATLAGSTWPFIQRNVSSLGSQADITIGVSNDGVGPAKIRSVELFFDGKPLRSTKDLLIKCCGYRADVPMRQQLAQSYQGAVIDNSVLRAGESSDIVRIRASTETPQIHRKLSAVLPRITFRGCYCSVLDHCWSGDLATTRVTAVASCPPPAHPFDPIDK